MGELVLKMIILLSLFNITLFGKSVSEGINSEVVEITLEPFGAFAMIVTVILISLIGAFYLKDDLS